MFADGEFTGEINNEAAREQSFLFAVLAKFRLDFSAPQI